MGEPAGGRPHDARHRPELSVVIPCYNEEDSLPQLVDVLSGQLAQVVSSYEVILVDDGSRDRTLPILREISRGRPEFRYLALSRNFGKEAAMLAGLSHAHGDKVAIMDADLQHPPELLARMLPLLDGEVQQVVARRTRDDDPAVRTFLSKAYYRLINRLVDVELEDGVGDFRVLDRTAVKALLTLGETNRFSKGLFAWIGFETAVVDYRNVSRAAGTTKWRMSDLFNYGIDGVVSFNYRPLRLSIWFGVFVTAVAVLYAGWVLVAAIVHGNSAPGYVTLICAISGFGGVQMILLGVIGEYLGRIYAETKRRPLFLLKETSQPGGGGGVPMAVTTALGPEHEDRFAPHEEDE